MSRSVIAWSLYDLANTIFAINMTSYHFPVWVVSEKAARELLYGLAFGISTVSAALVMPWVGRLSDRAGRRIPGLVGWTLGCVVLTSILSWVPSVAWALLIFALANFSYQLAGIYYNALLPSVSPAKAIGKVSGLGVALGYVGTLIGILATAPFVDRWGRQAAFFPTGLLYLLLALPCFFLVRDGSPQPSERTMVRREPSLNRFLWAAFWPLCSVSTVILFMSVYAKEAIGFSDAELHRFLIGSTLAAIVGSLAWGKVTDRIGGYRTLGLVWILWISVFAVACLTFHPVAFWFLGIGGGVALGGTWVSSRVLLVELVGPERIGQAFGFFGLVSRVSALVGPLMWGILLWIGSNWGPLRYRLAMGAMLLFVLLGWWLYRTVFHKGSDTFIMEAG